MKNSKIEWTHHSFNAWVGCAKISPECTHCYAETLAMRYWGVKWGLTSPRHRFGESYWKQPLQWDKRCKKLGIRERVFTNSLADVFDEAVPDQWRHDLFDLAYRCQNLDWLVLTKRPEYALKFIGGESGTGRVAFEENFPNVWMGASVGVKSTIPRIDVLRHIHARVRFLSLEPLLEDLGQLNLNGIHWVIVGGESGHGCRPMKLEWARSIQEQCQAAGVAFFMKQLGGAVDKGGSLESIPADLRIREFPKGVAHA